MPVSESFEGQPVWEGVVHVFELRNHPSATRAYAWSSPIEGSTARRFFAVLQIPPITSPVEAVRAAIVQEHGGHEIMTDDEIHTAWSRSVAVRVIDALVTAKIVAKGDCARATPMVAEEIYARLVLQDRPDRENWRYKSN